MKIYGSVNVQKKILWKKETRAKYPKENLHAKKIKKNKSKERMNVIFIIKNDEIKNYTLCFFCHPPTRAFR